MAAKQAPYGTWESSITSDLIVSGAVPLKDILYDPSTPEFLYWVESRPSEGGRYVLVQCHLRTNAVQDVLPPGSEYNCRTTVHEYGGAPVTAANGRLIWSNFQDQRLYESLTPGENPVPITQANAPYRYADGAYDPVRNAIFIVREDHSVDQPAKVRNDIVMLRLDSERGKPILEEKVVVSGADFYSSPRISPDGKKLAYVSWNHPNMPFDNTFLDVAELTQEGDVSCTYPVMRSDDGNPVSNMEPRWAPGTKQLSLYFISDQSSWWNIWRADFNDASSSFDISHFFPMEAEVGGPTWVFGNRSFELLSDTCLLFVDGRTGSDKVTAITFPQSSVKSLKDSDLKVNEVPGASVAQSIGGLSLVPTSNESFDLCYFGGGPSVPVSVFRVALQASPLSCSSSAVTCLRQSFEQEKLDRIDKSHISHPEHLKYPTPNPPNSESVRNEREAYGYYYPPANGHFTSNSEEKPPLLIKGHGGPNGATSTTFRIDIQYWTSRGFAVFDSNYGGSTGYGKEYRQRLYGQWGVVDVLDVCAAGKYLAEIGRVDGNRVCIDGRSAGGYTTLAALTFQQSVYGAKIFTAGASHFGVSDPEILAQETHKFESRYLDRLIGPYPHAKETYDARSPLKHVDKLTSPVIFFHGDEDKIVPPNQAELLFKALKEKGIKTSLVIFEGEQHGFRKAENIRQSLDGELQWYGKVWGFRPAGAEAMKPIKIEN
eukprot:gb/GECG01001992.1/.p1 GENE.gb/GECG01001992.1/~~gb/GECG01001992.1/.p1  ORF type:complete len:713 (+),score=73.71 gb/GECG01001992.1/:1-2139(+)